MKRRPLEITWIAVTVMATLAHLDTLFNWIERWHKSGTMDLNWYDFFIKTVMAVSLGLLISYVLKIREEITVWTIVQQERAMTIYKDAGGVPVARQHITEERKRVRARLLRKYKRRKTPSEIDDILEKIYNPDLS